MPVLREQDLDKLAAEVVDQYFAGAAKLADAAAKTASAHGLNPDQIERLVQSANTMTFLRGMDQRKQAGVGNLMHEFDAVDPSHVIRIVIDNAGVHVVPPSNGGSSHAASDAMEIPDEMSGVHLNPPEGAAGHQDSPKVEMCEEDCHGKFDPPGVQTKKKRVEAREGEDPDDDEAAGVNEAPKSAAVRISRARKLAGILEDQYRQAEWAYEERYTKLAGSFKRIYNPLSFEAFEKDAMAEKGDHIGVTILNGLRAERKMPLLEKSAAFEKVAALQDRYISNDSPELQLFEELYEIATKAAKLEEGLTWVRAQCV